MPPEDINRCIMAGSEPPRKQRRPVLACEPCRRRKIKCDRQMPCRQCVNANIDDCYFVRNNRGFSTTAPFQGHNTRFSVFEQTPISTAAATTSSTSATAPNLNSLFDKQNGTRSSGSSTTTTTNTNTTNTSTSTSSNTSYSPNFNLLSSIENCPSSTENNDPSMMTPLSLIDPQLSLLESTRAPGSNISTPQRPVSAIENYNGDSADTIPFPNPLDDDNWLASVDLSLSSWPSDMDIDRPNSMLAAPTDSSEYSRTPSVDLYPARKTSFSGSSLHTKFYGQSHWTNFAHEPSEIMTAICTHEIDAAQHGCATFAQCKSIARTIKAQKSAAAAQPIASLQDVVPPRGEWDRLVQAYLRTFQTVFGILSVPAFLKDYKAFWQDSGSVEESFRVTLLLVMSIGSVFCTPQARQTRTTTLRWINMASTWLSSPEQQAKLEMDHLRIRCLLVLALQIIPVAGEGANWLSTGTLLRSGMKMGLHLDPETHSIYPTSSPSTIEDRRRLWATIVELDLQSSMDCGSVPGVQSDEYDCANPSNIDDDATQEMGGTSGNASKPIDQFTSSSIQVLLAKTLPIRLKAARCINTLHATSSFQETLSLSRELLAALKSCYDLLSSYSISSKPPGTFQRKLFDLLVQRFVLALHHPFAVQAMSDPLYYYSRKVCVETSSLLASHVLRASDDDFSQLCLSGKALFRVVYTQTALYMCTELTEPSEGERGAAFPTDHLMGDGSGNGHGRPSIRQQMHQVVERYLELAVARMRSGETSIKAYVLVFCLLARADGMHAGLSVGGEVSEAIKKSLHTCSSVLLSRLQQDSDPRTARP